MARPTLVSHAVPTLRLPRAAGQYKRTYSVRINGQQPPSQAIRTVADLKAWRPATNVPDVEVCGWVRSVRKSPGVRFVDITDGSCMRPMQAVVDKALATDIRPGAAVRVKGTWHSTADRQKDAADESPVSGHSHSHQQATHEYSGMSLDALGSQTLRELRVEAVDILGSSDHQSNPIQNKYQTPESLRLVSHLRCRTPLNSTLLRLRSDAIASLTNFFFKEGFQQTHPPIITSSDCEGAGEAFTVKTGSKEEFFKQTKYLTVSSQLHLEALAQSLGNVWTLSPTFRAEKSDTSRHLSEFYMLEAEMEFVKDMDEVMDLVQKMLMSLATSLKELRAANELEKNRLDARDPAEKGAFADLVERQELQRRWAGLSSPNRWPKITYSDAMERLQPIADQFEHKPVWGSGLQSEHEKYLAKEIGYDKATDAYVPVFVTQYPRKIKAFYMHRSASPPPQGETVDCFDLLVPDLGELAGGSMREHRLSELEHNMTLHGLEVPTKKQDRGNGLGWYLDLRRWGCPPHGGFGLGFDRLLSYLSGVPNIRDVVPFPRHHQRCQC
ncbi:related to asn-tRNA synthetase, mitochondrial [Claviceps purpurea 20.1]|uniref:asparagine--tRNA ligase n=1 Tax=Claviceps purpurea (strain 20.1) TaxID=1111077 RepID=M1WCX9_CLAP2|nr:related to asn-tRNA synthetase, mitochondrial [Claviceps purpurea 20.1]